MIQIIGLIVGVYVSMRCIEIFCFNPSRYTRKGTSVLMKLVAAGTLLVTVILTVFLMDTSSATAPPTTDTESSGRLPVLAPGPVVTMEEYKLIETGHSWAQVRVIIDALGSEESRSERDGYTTVTYSWTNSDGSKVVATFQSPCKNCPVPKLVTKAQFGLP